MPLPLPTGLAQGDKKLARDTMHAVWSAVERAGVPDLLRLNPFLFGLAKAAPLPNVAAFLFAIRIQSDRVRSAAQDPD